MVTRMVFIWVLGLLTLVPYSIYYLLFSAQRDEYAFYIVLPLFWIFGYWGVVGPVLSAIKLRRVFRALELAASPEQRKQILHSQESREVAIEMIAAENRIPKFLAKKLYDYAVKRFSEQNNTVAHKSIPGDQ